MTQETTLILEFLDEDNNVKKLRIPNPKEDLSKETVTEVMNIVIDKDALLTNAGRHYTSINNCYYRTVIIDELEFASEGE